MNKIYCWGKPISNCFQPFRMGIYVTNIKEQIQSINCGLEYCWLVTKSKKEVWSFGDNSYGQLGVKGDTLQSETSLTRVEIPTIKAIIQVSCGWYHTLLLDEQGTVYSCGKGEDGALGLGDMQNRYMLTKVMKKVKMISAGKDHSLALCGSKVYGWGNSYDGQLGFLNRRIYSQPKQLNVFPCTFCYATAKCSIFITVRGIYGTGLNHNYQLGLGHNNLVLTPKKISIQKEVVKIFGKNYLYAMTIYDQIYIWGSGIFGQFRYATKVTFFNKIHHLSEGLNFGISQDWNQKIIVWGTNQYRQLALQNTQIQSQPVISPSLMKLGLLLFNCGGNFTIGYTANDKNQIVSYAISYQQEERINLPMESKLLKISEPNIHIENNEISKKQKQYYFQNQQQNYLNFHEQNIIIDKNQNANKNKNKINKNYIETLESKIILLQQKVQNKSNYIKNIRKQHLNILQIINNNNQIQQIFKQKQKSIDYLSQQKQYRQDIRLQKEEEEQEEIRDKQMNNNDTFEQNIEQLKIILREVQQCTRII